MIPEWKTYPRSQGHSTVYLQNVVHSDFIEIGDYTTYDDFEKDPRDFQRNNVLYHYPECNHDKLIIGKFCSIACGAKFIFNAANHTLGSLSTYPFPIYFEEWELPTDVGSIAQAWDNHGDIVVGNDVWIGYEAVTAGNSSASNGRISSNSDGVFIVYLFMFHISSSGLAITSSMPWASRALISFWLIL